MPHKIEEMSFGPSKRIPVPYAMTASFSCPQSLVDLCWDMDKLVQFPGSAPMHITSGNQQKIKSNDGICRASVLLYYIQIGLCSMGWWAKCPKITTAVPQNDAQVTPPNHCHGSLQISSLGAMSGTHFGGPKVGLC